MARPRCIVIGLGNPDRGDDGAGGAVARLLREAMPGVEVAEERGEATAVVARFAVSEAAFLVDACASGAPAGTMRRLDVGAAPLPHDAFGFSTHGFGLAAAVELARALGRLPARCIVYAIEGACFDLGAPLSPAVARAVPEVAARVRAEIAALGMTEQPGQCTKPH